MSIKLFDFLLFVVFGFLTHKKEKIDQKQHLENMNESMQKQTNKFQITLPISKQPNKVTKHRKY